MSDIYIREFYKEVCQTLDGEYKIVLEPKRNLIEDWIEYDVVKWEIENPVQELVNNLTLDKTLSLEEKIIKVYEFICLNYVYDANVLYFFRTDSSQPNNIQYIPADWYGRIIGQDWIEHRKKHNRRICYEFSRCYAKAINTLINGKQDLEAFILSDKGNTHYVVGLAGKKYNAILDQDDFNSIKDLTRLKMGLTIKGIHILKDKTRELTDVLNNYNKNRLNELEKIELAKMELKDKDFIKYINIAINSINQYNIDAQGFFEYIRSVIENEGIKIEKIWKEDIKNDEKRYERCLYFEYKNETYLLDSINKTLKIVSIDDLDKKVFIFNPEENEYKYYGG